MRTSSQILIFVDIQKALDAGINFYLSANGVVLTEGDEKGFLPPEFFSRVESADRKPLAGWDGPEGVASALVGKEDGQTQQQTAAPTDVADELAKKVETAAL